MNKGTTIRLAETDMSDRLSGSGGVRGLPFRGKTGIGAYCYGASEDGCAISATRPLGANARAYPKISLLWRRCRPSSAVSRCVPERGSADCRSVHGCSHWGNAKGFRV